MHRSFCVVPDTNLLISAAIISNSVSSKCYKAALRECSLIFSSSTLIELTEVLSRQKFEKYVTIEEKKEFLNRYIANASQIQVTSTITDCRDPKDNKFLELAIDGKADYIITGDQDLLVLHPYRNISIVTPSQFLEIVTQGY